MIIKLYVTVTDRGIRELAVSWPARYFALHRHAICRAGAVHPLGVGSVSKSIYQRIHHDTFEPTSDD